MTKTTPVAPAEPAQNESAPNNLAQQLTSFVGRTTERADVVDRIEHCRLLTLIGAGGCGKTRLAHEAATSVLEDGQFPDGVWWIELAPLVQPELLEGLVASVLGVADDADTSVTESLAKRLASDNALLVFDNCEHVLTACAQLVYLLLQRCDSLHLLTTSRTPLNVVSEHVLVVAPMHLTPPDDAKRGDPLLSEAVQLFVARASAASSDFTIDDQVARQAWAVCRRLDGMPLAIELAAVRVRSLSLSAIADRLDDSLGLLTRSGIGTAPHHQTMRAAIRWSHDLLDGSQQVMLRRLSVFAGGFTIAAAKAVCAEMGETPSALPAKDVPDIVADLAEQSLVTTGHQSKGRMRYRVLEPIRQFGAEKLRDATEEEQLRDRHLKYFASMAREAEPHLLGASMSDWLHTLDDEHANVRAAIRWSTCGADRALHGLVIAAALWRYWLVRGRLREGRKYLAHLLDQAIDVPDMDLARAYNAAGILDNYLDQLGSAREHFGLAHGLSERNGDEHMAALMLGNLGMVDVRESRFEEAKRHYERSCASLREQGDDRGVANALGNLGLVLLDQGDLDGSEACSRESLSLMRQLEDDWGVAMLQLNLAEVEANRGRYAESTALLESSLDAFTSLADDRLSAQVRCNLAQIGMMQGRVNESVEQLDACLQVFRDVGDDQQTAVCLMRLGRAARLKGELRKAASRLTESSNVVRQRSNRRLGCELLFEMASLLANWSGVGLHTDEADLVDIARKHTTRATELFAAAGSLASDYGVLVPPTIGHEYDRIPSLLQSSLGEDSYQRARRRGEGLSMDKAFDLAFTEAGDAALARLERHLLAAKRTPLQAKRAEFGGLTSREREVAALLVRGLTNPQIADELTVAPKTVEHHIGNILSKLGFENRAQVAAWAVEKGLAEAPEDLDSQIEHH